MLSRRKLIKLAAPAIIIPKEAFAWRKGSPSGTGPSWQIRKIGGGGFVTGIDIAADGTKVCRTDTYGAYVCPAGQTAWTQIASVTNLPGTFNPLANFQQGGVEEIVIAPSNTQRFYMMAGDGNTYITNNQGSSWTLTSLATQQASPNFAYPQKLFGKKIAVDPANADVVLVGTETNGVFISSNAGVSFSSIAGITPSTDPNAGEAIAFDPSSTVTGGKTQGIYAVSYGVGVYHSTNGGTSWTLLNSAGMPTTYRHMVCASDGVLYIVPDEGAENVKFYNGSWTNKVVGSTSVGSQAVAVDPSNANRIIVCDQGGDLSVSTDHAANFSGYPSARFSATRVASDISWLAFTREAFMTAANIQFDPSGSNKLYFCEGIGIWSASPPNSASTQTWTSQTAPIENLVGNFILSPPSGSPIIMALDRPEFYSPSPSAYPSITGVASPQNDAIVHGFSGSFVPGTPATVVCVANAASPSVVEHSGKSTDGGQTFTAFGAVPSGVPGTNPGGGIAASTTSHYVWAPGVNTPHVYFTANSGGSWSNSTFTGATVPTTGETGWGDQNPASVNRQIICADQVTSDVFYIYNNGKSGDASFAGIYKSTDGGANFARVKSGLLNTYGLDHFGAKLRAVPSNAGHLFFVTGESGGTPTAQGAMQYCLDSGVTWNAVSGMLGCFAVGFGKAAPGKTYPALYVAGFFNTVWGIWKCINAGDNISNSTLWTWTKINDFPLGNFVQINWIEGDPDTYSTVYIATAGGGFIYGNNI